MFNKTILETFDEFKTNASGLTAGEAQVRLARNGENALEKPKKQSFLTKVLLQFINPMVLLLLAAGLISLAMGLFGHGDSSEIFEAGIIFLIVFVNAFIGVLQEGKAEKALESLNKMSEPYCKVYRNGTVAKIKTTEIVVGDVVILEAGDIVPADGRIIKEAMLNVEESALTGESLPVAKHSETIAKEKVSLGDRKNMVFSGSIVTYGRCEFVVTATGMNTEMGRIANLLSSSKKEQTQLQKKLNAVGKFITFAVLGIAATVFASMAFMGDIRNAFMTAIVLAVAAIPEGLPAVVTIVMALGVSKLSKKNAIIRRLTAVETLGCTQIICSDKTGTLTLNKMTIKKLSTLSEDVDDNHVIESEDMKKVLNCMVYCNDSKVVKNDDGKVRFVGDPTETALVEFAYKNNIDKNLLEAANPRVDEIPFDSNRKMMSVVNNVDGVKTVFAKGGIDEILAKCSYVFIDGNKAELTVELIQKILEKSDNMSKEALRVLGYAVKEVQSKNDKYEEGLVFAGLSGMIDPPREEVATSIVTCKEAGIKVVMITGDHKNTAMAVAKKIGILTDDGEVLLGKELDELSDEEFEKRIENVCVYARVSPENKVRIVKTFKKLGKIVAMTGDGVNDAPSLKNAHIGIGMGITGTDVTKSVADMVLADDNFATIETAVSEGRKIYANIQKAIAFLLSSNLCEVLALFSVVLFALFTGNTSLVFLAPVHLLWVNLVTDTFPALAFSNCEPDHNIMKIPPRKDDKNIFKSRLGLDILFGGIFQTAIILTVFFITLHAYDNKIATTMTLITLNLIQLFHSFNVQARESIFKTNIFHNKSLIYAFILGAGLTFAVVYVPFISKLFGTSVLNFMQFMVSLFAAMLIIPLYEIYKMCLNKKS